MPPRAALLHAGRSDIAAGCLLSLPPDVVRELRQVTKEMRDMPRACATDRAELVFWLSRLARRIDRIVDSKVSAPRPLPSRPIAILPPTAPTAPAAALPRPVAVLVAPAAPVRTVGIPRRQASPPARWKARPVDAATRRRIDANGQLPLFD